MSWSPGRRAFEFITSLVWAWPWDDIDWGFHWEEDNGHTVHVDPPVDYNRSLVECVAEEYGGEEIEDCVWLFEEDDDG